MKAQFVFQSQENQWRTRQLTEAGVRRFAASNRPVSFEPVLEGSTTDPSGYNSALTNDANRLRAKYIRTGDRFDMWFSLLCGSSFNGGSGSWTMSLPDGITTPNTNTLLAYASVGQWHAYDSNTSNRVFGPILFDTSNDGVVLFRYPATSPIGATTAVGSANPWTWASNDIFGGHISFPII
jgi:hypothetical protein